MSLRERRDLDELLAGGWRDEETLVELHEVREWTAADIARRFDADPDAVLEELKERDVYMGGSTHPPKNGRARELWEMGTDPDVTEGGE